MKMVKLLSLCAVVCIISSCIETTPCRTCEVDASARTPNSSPYNGTQHHASKSTVKKLPTYSYSGKSLTQRKLADTEINV